MLAALRELWRLFNVKSSTAAAESSFGHHSNRASLIATPRLMTFLSLPPDHEGFPAQLHSDVELPPKGEAVEPGPSEELYRAAVEMFKSKL